MAKNKIPDNFLNLFEKPVFGWLSTVMPDGSPQVTPVWCEFDGTHVRINSARGRVKDKNMRRNPHVAIALQDPENGYRYVEVRGQVVDITENGADAQIDSLAKKYLGKDKYPFRTPTEVRVSYKIRPDHVSTMG